MSDLPDLLRGLYAAERAAPVADLAHRSAVRAKLAATVGAAPLGSAAAATSVLAGAGKVLAVLALAIGAGTLATRAETEAAIQPPPPVAIVSTDAAIAIEGDVRMAVYDEPSMAQQESRAPAPPSAPRSPVVDPRETQTQLLHDAMTAIGNDPARALALVRRDEELHPRGALAEERAVLEIEALTALGRTSEATAARTRFASSYPRSIHRLRVGL